MRKTTTTRLALLFVIGLAPLQCFAGGKTGNVPHPLSAGPFPVGVTTTVFIDTSRVDNFTKQPRTLVTEIWYPATDDARRMPGNKYSDFIPGGATPEIDDLIKKTYKMSAT